MGHLHSHNRMLSDEEELVRFILTWKHLEIYFEITNPIPIPSLANKNKLWSFSV